MARRPSAEVRTRVEHMKFWLLVSPFRVQALAVSGKLYNIRCRCFLYVPPPEGCDAIIRVGRSGIL